MKAFDQTGRVVNVPKGTPEQSFTVAGKKMRCYTIDGRVMFDLHDFQAIMRSGGLTRDDLVKFAQNAKGPHAEMVKDNLTERAQGIEQTIARIRAEYATRPNFKLPSDVWLTLALDGMMTTLKAAALSPEEAMDFVATSLQALLHTYNEKQNPAQRA